MVLPGRPVWVDILGDIGRESGEWVVTNLGLLKPPPQELGVLAPLRGGGPPPGVRVVVVVVVVVVALGPTSMKMGSPLTV